jgi:hypothetical protein
MQQISHEELIAGIMADRAAEGRTGPVQGHQRHVQGKGKAQTPNRRKVQGANRSANKFNLQPMTEARSSGGGIAQQPPLPLHLGEHETVEPQVTPHAIDLDLSSNQLNPVEFTRVAGFGDTEFLTVDLGDPVADLAAELITAIQTGTPPPRPADWPRNAWNKKLVCCGEIERNCQCGAARRYV